MSISSDIRSYADNAVAQGKQALDQAQAQLNDVTGQANELVGKLTGTAKENVSSLSNKATDTVNDLRTQAEKAINLDAIKAAVEPYLAQAKGYTHSVTDRAESLYNTVRNDKRVAKLVTTAESFTDTLVETVQERFVKPVQSLTGLGQKPAAVKPTPAKTTPKPATKAAPKPSAAKATVRKSTARKSARKSTAE